MPLLGPLFYEELNRLGRRNAVYLLRVGLVGFLLAAVALQHPGDAATVGINQLSAFAQELFAAVVGVQLAAVWFLTPLFAAAVLTEEREKKTLDLLLTTTLTNREIVAGKLLARLAFVGGTILAGMPVMAMLLVYGGVTGWQVGVAYLGLLAYLWSIGGTAAAIAASQRTYRAALYLSWLAIGGLACCPLFGPAPAIWTVAAGDLTEWPWYVAFFLTHFALGLGGLIAATLSVRPWEAAEVERVRVPAKGTGPRPVARPVVTRRVEPALANPDRDRPPGIAADIDWRHPPGPLDGPTPRQVLVGGFVAAVGLGLLAGLARFEEERPARVWPAYMVLGWVPAAVATAVQAAGAVSREREADTLTMLLTVPPSRTEILWRKYLAAAVRHLWLFVVTAGIALVVFCPFGGWEWYPGFLAQGVGMIGAAASAGILLTVVCRTTFLAQAAAVLAVLFLAVLPGWANIVLPEEEVVGFVPVHYAGLLVIAVAGWHLAVATFRGYAKR